MQDLISQVEDLAGIEIDHTTSMVMIFTGVREKHWPMLY